MHINKNVFPESSNKNNWRNGFKNEKSRICVVVPYCTRYVAENPVQELSVVNSVRDDWFQHFPWNYKYRMTKPRPAFDMLKKDLKISPGQDSVFPYARRSHRDFTCSTRNIIFDRRIFRNLERKFVMKNNVKSPKLFSIRICCWILKTNPENNLLAFVAKFVRRGARIWR